MTIKSILEEFENLAPEYGKWRIDRNLAKAWLTQKLTEYRNSVIDECIGVVPESTHVLTGANLQHSKEELYCCIECYEDKFFNMCGTQTINRLNNFKV